jgi:hypothetical protein
MPLASDRRRRHKLRQHAASLATGAIVFLVSISLMQALKPPAAAGTSIVASSAKPGRQAPSSSGSSDAGVTGAGAEESEAAAPPTNAAAAAPGALATPASGKSAAAQIMGMPSVYIHVLDENTREQALKLAPALEKKGIALAGIKVVGAGPRASDLRYFRPSEKEEAMRVQAALLSLGLPAQRLKSISGFETSAVPRQYELWLVSDYRG